MIYLLISALAIALDRLLKGWIVENLTEYSTRKLIPGVISLTRIPNDAAAFGLFGGMRWIILAITLLFCLLAIIALITGFLRGAFGRVSLAMVLGGALGNAIDRLFNGGIVVDMFKTEFIDFAIFNVADIFIVVGGIMLCIYVLLEDRRGRRKAALPQSGVEAEEDLPELDEDQITFEDIMLEYELKERHNADEDSN